MTPATREASETARADNRCSRRSGQWFTAIPDAFLTIRRLFSSSGKGSQFCFFASDNLFFCIKNARAMGIT
jgi:hypothetical protein